MAARKARGDGRPRKPAGQAEAVLRRMTIREKIAMLSGKDGFSTRNLDRLAVGSIVLADGPHGVKPSEAFKATAFPTGVALAATWNADLAEAVGRALGDETRACRTDVLLGPCVNIVRTPLAGRNFETFSEDPCLAGRLGVRWVQGLQSRGVSACLKHLACNNQEVERFRGNSVVEERALREIYLAQFEMIVKEARPWSVMCAYNRLNGTYASEHHRLLNDILRGEWGYQGVVVSDWGANHTIVESLKGGLDLEMPGPAKYYGALLADAFHFWQIDEHVIDGAVLRLLRWAEQCGKLGRRAAKRPPAVDFAAHQRLARRVAEESMVLLKNEGGALPIDLGAVKSIAVIGPTATAFPISGAGSSFVNPAYRLTPLDELRRMAGNGIRINHARGCENVESPPMMTAATLAGTDNKRAGLRAEFFNNSKCAGKPVCRRCDEKCDFWLDNKAPADGVECGSFSARWSATVCVPETGRYVFRAHALGRVRVFIDDRAVLSYRTAPEHRREPGPAFKDGWAVLTAGKRYRIRVEYAKFPEEEIAYLTMQFGRDHADGAKAGIAEAVALARKADLALVFVGHPEEWEGEGYDRPGMRLPGRQDELVRAIARANARTVVVWSGGAPTLMPWLDDVKAVLAALYPGQEGAAALVRLLLGEANPSGRLPVTFPRRYEDNPTYGSYPGGRDTVYKEGIFVGYRHYDRAAIDPLFAFGFGLSYTSFRYEAIDAPAVAAGGAPIDVRVRVSNTGTRAGQEVVQLYVADVEASLPRPPKELKGFAKVALQPGESRDIRFVLNARDFSFYDPARGQWVLEPGEFRLLAGASSRDIRLERRVRVVGTARNRRARHTRPEMT
jgi:beta-glucosidase